MLLGHVIAGAWASLTVTVKLQLDVLPAPLVAVAVTVVVPFGNANPGGGLLTTVTPVQRSDASTVKLTTAVHSPGSASRVMFAGQVIEGGVESTTVTVAEHSLETPRMSVTVNVTVVVPSGYGAGGDWLVVTAPPSGSVEPLLIEALAVQVGPADTVTF
jgi:hypothetical protein